MAASVTRTSSSEVLTPAIRDHPEVVCLVVEDDHNAAVLATEPKTPLTTIGVSVGASE